MSYPAIRIYVGKSKKTGNREVFRSDCMPTDATHGHRYGYAIGPFRTVRAARFMASPAASYNPHCVTVADAERIAKENRQGLLTFSRQVLY